MASTALIGKQLNMNVSSRPSANAYYVGAVACYNCHGRQHEKYSLHLNGIRPTGTTGPLQKADKLPELERGAREVHGRGM